MLPRLLGAVVGVVILASGNAGGMTLYGTGSGYLWTIDKTTGATTVIGSTPDLTDPFGDINALAFDASGTLYGTGSSYLWTIDKSTGATTVNWQHARFDRSLWRNKGIVIFATASSNTSLLTPVRYGPCRAGPVRLAAETESFSIRA